MSQHYRIIATILASIILIGCSTTETPTHEKSYWVLEADVVSKKQMVLLKNMKQAQVAKLLGKPKKTRKEKSDPSLEVWTFERTIEGPMGHTTMASKSAEHGGIVQDVYQPVLYRETIIIHFNNGLIDHVEIDKRLKNISSSVPRIL